MTRDDLWILAKMIWAKARGEPLEGQIAVANVILNRVRRGGWWGDTVPGVCLNSISSSQANYGGNTAGDKTVPVGSYPVNGFGLYDVRGNVWEWTEDCWNGGYAGAPSDTNVWKAGDCSRRVLRGGSWHNLPRFVRSTTIAIININVLPSQREEACRHALQ